MRHYIYKITCLCGSFKNHYYIGKRSTRHEDLVHDFYYGSGEKLRRYYKKYPAEIGVTISKEIIEENPTKEINAKREREIIGDLYLTDPLCLNLMEGGNGRKVSKETSRKKSAINKGRKLSKETKAKMSAAKIRDNSVKSLKQYYETHDVWNKGKIGLYGNPVACYNLDGVFLRVYDTASLAEEELKLGTGSMSGHLNNPDKHHRVGDYMFRRFDENTPMRIEPYASHQKKRYGKISKPIMQYSLSGEYINTYGSIEEAQKAMNQKSAAKLYDYLNGKRENAWGYLWKRAS